MECSAEVGAGGAGNDHAFAGEVEGDYPDDGTQDSRVGETPRLARGSDLVSNSYPPTLLVLMTMDLREDAATLYSTTTSTVLPAGNLSSDPLKLQGTFEFPFKLHLPSRVARIPEELPADGTPLRSTWLTLPPSFVLSGEANGGARGSEWASCRYFLKVTLGRKGLLKSNERLIVPIIYLPRGREPRTSPLRTLALSQGRTPPGPLEDPSGWAGKYVLPPSFSSIDTDITEQES